MVNAAEAAPGPASDADALAGALGVSRTLAAWLVRLGHTDSQAAASFLSPRLSGLTMPDGMADREVAVGRLADAVRRGEPVAVFGDYDCDGMTSAALLSEALEALGGRISTFVASRFEGGYGVSPHAVERLLLSGAKLVVTCDCGSSDHESLARLRERGVEVIVIDHHLVPERPLPALAFLNPHRPECQFPFKYMASCGLALSVAAGVRSALGRTLDLRSLLDLVAIGTVADVAPLTGDNRALVRAGLAVLGEARRPGLRALFANAKIDAGRPLPADDIAFRIAPRLNAPGRLGSPEPALRLLTERDPERAQALAAEIEQASVERRLIQDNMVEEALLEVRERGLDRRAAIVVGREGWNTGIVGIVAGRLADRFERPVAVIGFQNGEGRGSVRGPRGSRLHDALAGVEHLLVRYGGHQAAAGLEVTHDRLLELEEAFDRSVLGLKASSNESQADRASADTALPIALAPGDRPSRVLADLERLEPCGEQNPYPELKLRGELLLAREVNGGHLKLELLVSGERLGAFGVGLGARAAELRGEVTVSGRLRRDTFRGGDSAELKIARIEP